MTNEDQLTDNIEKMEEVVLGLKSLVASEGWKYYIAIVQEQRAIRQQHIMLTPLAGVDAAFEQEYKKGEVQGLHMSEHLPHQMIEDFSQQVAILRKQRDAEQGD